MRLAFVCLLLVALWPAAAHANGRFPQSNAVFFAPDAPSTIIVRATFGLLVSHDRGLTWDWVCEPAIGLVGVEDPMLAITPDNTIVSTTFQGLAVSHDNACGWSFVPGPLTSLVFVDSASRPGAVVAFSSSFVDEDTNGNLTYASAIFETTDQGQTFTQLGPAVDPLLLGRTLDVANTDPDRIYISAIATPGPHSSGVLMTSLDHGKTFTENAVPFVGDETGLFIAGVDPVNADRLYARTAGESSDVPSRLLVSDDAGKTFRTIFTGVAALQGFAISNDGTKIWTGGPKDGLLMASTTDYTFTPRSSAAVSCLKVATDGLWACSSEASGFVLGVSGDDGTTFTPKLHFCDVRGSLACATGTSVETQCTASWPAQYIALGCGDAGADASVDAGPPPAAVYDAGGCSLRAPAHLGAAPLLTGAAAAIALYRRRRRRRQRLEATASSSSR